MRAQLIKTLSFIVPLTLTTAQTLAAPNFTISGPIGLTGDGYSYNNPYSSTPTSYIFGENAAHQYLGVSVAYGLPDVYGDARIGQTAWIYDSTQGTYAIIGLTDAEHSNQYGYSRQSTVAINDNGYAIGTALQHRSGGAIPALVQPKSAWLYDGANTRNIGLRDSEHSLDGFSDSDVQSINAANQVLGYSHRFNGAEDAGTSAWIYDAATQTHTVLDITDTEHTGANGYRVTYGRAINNRGDVLGTSYRFTNDEWNGESVWLHTEAGTVFIGLRDAQHTDRNDFRSSYANALNKQGQAIGRSTRFHADGYQTGTSAWFYNGIDTVRIGMIAGVHSDAIDSQEAVALNNHGVVIGKSTHHYDGDAPYLIDYRYDAWRYDGTSTTTELIGLYDAEHTGAVGQRTHSAEQINDAGQIIGHSARFNGAVDVGVDAWIYQNGATRKIGLTDADHTYSGEDAPYLSNGHRHTTAQHLNANGQVIGYSFTYNDAAADINGQTAWMYDAASEQTFAFTLSKGQNDAEYSDAQLLTDDGRVFGSYSKYDDAGEYVGERIFYFSIADGLWDLGSLITNLEVSDWATLANVVETVGIGHIGGNGVLVNGGQMGFILSAAPSEVPVPAAAWLFGSALLLTASARRRLR